MPGFPGLVQFSSFIHWVPARLLQIDVPCTVPLQRTCKPCPDLLEASGADIERTTGVQLEAYSPPVRSPATTSNVETWWA